MKVFTKRILTLILISSVILSFTSCIKSNASELENYEIKPVDKKLIDSNTNFAFKVFNELVNEDKNNNVFISPLSISTVLTMAYNGADGSTKTAMEKTLQLEEFESTDDINNAYKNLLDNLKKIDKNIELNIANSIWSRKELKINDTFIKQCKENYYSLVRELDFELPTAANDINKWISNVTNGKINSMLSPQQIKNSVLYLINAIYFKGQWTNKFNEKLTKEDKFILSDKSIVKIPMMYSKEEYKYYRDDTCCAIRLPYGNENTAMYVFLPNNFNGLDEFISSLTKEKWENLMSSFSAQEVIVRIPKFKIEYGTKSLNNTLTKLGMNIALTKSADFSKIAPQLYISQVMHKAVIDVNEKGSEAAAVTICDINTTSCESSKPIEFTVNRPFFFIISDDTTQSILFMGKVVNPS